MKDSPKISLKKNKKFPNEKQFMATHRSVKIKNSRSVSRGGEISN